MMTELPPDFKRQLALFEAMMETIPVGVVVTDAAGQILEGNSQLEEMVRHPIFHSRDAEAYGEWVSFHADGRRVASHEYPLARVINGETDRCELTVHYQRGDGTKFWMRIIGRAIKDDDGVLMGAAVACVDVDEEHTLTEAQNVLIAELNHRVKNAFSVTNAIVGRSLRKGGVSTELRDDIDARLSAYAAAHSMLIGTDYTRAPLAEIARSVLFNIDDQRIAIEGEEVIFSTRRALPFSMAFYELASNAIKYGSLAEDDGHVRLSWTVDRTDASPRLHIHWQERGGRAATKPAQEGFGSFVTGRALCAETGGSVERTFSEQGFEWIFEMPLTSENVKMPEREIIRVFVVEDEVFVAYEMNDMLEELGFEVVGPALNAEDAQRIARTAEIDAAFLDVNLGGGKTSEVTSKILRERGVPFVFVTAYTPDQITFRTSEDEVLEKPVTSKKVYETLKTVLPHLESVPE